MALLVSEIKLPIDAGFGALAQRIAASFAIPQDCVQAVRVVRQSVDARDKSDIHFKISAVVQLEAVWQARLLKSGDRRVRVYEQAQAYALPRGSAPMRGRVVVAGLGPAGLYAAYFLAREGYKPLCVERGKDVKSRRADVEAFWQTGKLDSASNVAFGEGGAGTFSDGKLTSRSKNPRGQVVLDTFSTFGAPPDILYAAKPHMGTDVLQQVVVRMREEIIRLGGEVRFGAQLTDVTLDGDAALSAVSIQEKGVVTRVDCAACVLATGQAAHDTYQMLLNKGIALQARAFAVGARIEHPQGLIDRAQYGALAGSAHLGAAEYALTARSGNRGVYTFCMCPGGQVINAASAEEQVVVNGMSLRARNLPNANAAVVVQVGPADFGTGPLDGLRFQRVLESRAFLAGGGNYMAPAQRWEDFLKKRNTYAFSEVKPTCLPGVQKQRLDTLLPDFVVAGIRTGIQAFARQLKGFDLPDAVLTGVETRTSSPVRILRDERGCPQSAYGLYPVGEGAGYAGGIVSAAIDGMMAAEKIAARFAPEA